MNQPLKRPCNHCGQLVEFHDNPDGTAVLCLQKIRTVYQLRNDLFDRIVKVEIPEAGAGQLYQSHYETCPKAGEFSKKQRGKR